MFKLFKLKELDNEIINKQYELDMINKKLSDANNKYYNINKQISQEENRLDKLKNKNNALDELYDAGYVYIEKRNSSELEDKRVEVQDRLIEYTKDKLYKIVKEYNLDGSSRKGEELQNAVGKGYVYAMTAYIDNQERLATYGNVQRKKELIVSKFNYYQNKAYKIGIALNKNYVQCRIELMEVNTEIKEAKRAENKKIKEQKKRLKEQEQLLIEAAQERKRLEAEKKAMDVAFKKALTDEERCGIIQKMQDIDKRIADVDYRCTHQQSGWLYVISSPALPDMVKIGVTRRLNPTIRVKELSSSSVPFPFNTHCFVFSDDCFELESNMHKHFDAVRVHLDREFFYTTPQEAIDVLRNVYHCEINFEMKED